MGIATKKWKTPCAVSILFLLSACDTTGFQLNNFQAERAATLQKQPELEALLQEKLIPQDEHIHCGTAISRVVDRGGTGWQFTIHARVAWPRFVRLKYPHTYPPEQ